MTKKLFIPFILLILLVVSTSLFSKDKAPYESTISWVVALDSNDASAGLSHDTQTGLFNYTGLYNYQEIDGFIYVKVTKLDTGEVSTEVPDTTKDSMLYVLKTACRNNAGVVKVIEVESLIPAGSAGDTVWFTIAAESTICTEVYLDIVTAVADSDHVIAARGAGYGIHYQATVFMVAKEEGDAMPPEMNYRIEQPDWVDGTKRFVKAIRPDLAEWKIDQSQDDGSLIIEGWVSRIEPDRGNDIVEPKAFTDKVLNKYMQKPIVLFNHRFFDLPIGKTLSVERVEGQGLYAKVIIYPTNDRGADTILLLKNDVIDSFSFGFLVKKYEFDEETQVRTITELDEMIEISVVNLGMNELAVREKAKELHLELKSFKSKTFNINKGKNNMPPELKELEQKLDDTNGQVNQASAKVAEVQEQVDNLIVLTNAIKDHSATTEAETKQLIEKAIGDVKDSMGDLDTAIKDVAKQNKSYGASNNASRFSVKQIMEMREDRIERIFTKEKCEEIQQLKRLDMEAGIVDFLKCRIDREYASQPLEVRTKDLSIYQEFQMKAMDTATSNEGSQYVPSAVHTPTFWPMVKQELVVGNMHPTFPMRAHTVTDMVEGSDIEALRGTEKTTVVSAFNSTEQTPGSANITWTAEELWTRIQFSAEFDEDSLIDAASKIIDKSAIGIARSYENAVIAGDDAGGTGYDTGDTPAATAARYCWNGHRQMCQSTSKVDMGTFDSANLALLRSKGGKYFAKPQDFYWYTSIETYLRHILNPDELPEITTMEKYGAMATIVSGEVEKVYGAALLTSEWVLNTYNASGIYDGVTTDKGIFVGAHRNSMKGGIYKSLTIKMNEDIIDNVFNVVARIRVDFQPIYDATAETLVVIGYNINMA